MGSTEDEQQDTALGVPLLRLPEPGSEDDVQDEQDPVDPSPITGTPSKDVFRFSTEQISRMNETPSGPETRRRRWTALLFTIDASIPGSGERTCL